LFDRLGRLFFSTWGAFLNGCITMWLWSRQHDVLGVPYVSILLGLLLGMATPLILFSQDAKSALRTGFAFVFAVAVLFVNDLRSGTRLIVSFGQYAFSFLWALSLIVAGCFLRTSERRSLRDKAVS
jgi:hypothetical protein